MPVLGSDQNHHQRPSFAGCLARSLCWNDSQTPSFAIFLEDQPAPTLVEIVSERQALQTVGRGHSVKALAQEIIQSQTFADCSEGSLFQNLGAKHGRKSNFAHWLARSLVPSSGWNTRQRSMFANCLARSLVPGFCWNHCQRSTFANCLAKWILWIWGYHHYAMSNWVFFVADWANFAHVRSLSAFQDKQQCIRQICLDTNSWDYDCLFSDNLILQTLVECQRRSWVL